MHMRQMSKRIERHAVARRELVCADQGLCYTSSAIAFLLLAESGANVAVSMSADCRANWATSAIMGGLGCCVAMIAESCPTLCNCPLPSFFHVRMFHGLCSSAPITVKLADFGINSLCCFESPMACQFVSVLHFTICSRAAAHSRASTIMH